MFPIPIWPGIRIINFTPNDRESVVQRCSWSTELLRKPTERAFECLSDHNHISQTFQHLSYKSHPRVCLCTLQLTPPVCSVIRDGSQRHLVFAFQSLWQRNSILVSRKSALWICLSCLCSAVECAATVVDWFESMHWISVASAFGKELSTLDSSKYKNTLHLWKSNGPCVVPLRQIPTHHAWMLICWSQKLHILCVTKTVTDHVVHGFHWDRKSVV